MAVSLPLEVAETPLLVSPFLEGPLMSELTKAQAFALQLCTSGTEFTFKIGRGERGEHRCALCGAVVAGNGMDRLTRAHLAGHYRAASEQLDALWALAKLRYPLVERPRCFSRTLREVLVIQVFGLDVLTATDFWRAHV
jgi:hypothetical protein